MAIANKLAVLTANHVLKHDHAQLELARRLDRLAVLARTFHVDKQKYLLQSRHDLLLPKGVKSKFTPPRMPRGLFITGKVGTGKSMLMNLFLDELQPVVPHTRVHFHSFLEHINHLAFAKREKGKSTFDVLQDYGEILGRENAVFALDEFLFPDAGSNTMLQPVLEAVMKQSILVCTSNLAQMPDYLTCKMFNMAQNQDYRSLAGSAGPCQVKTYSEEGMTDREVQVGRLTVPLANLSKKTGLVEFSSIFASESYGVPEYSMLCERFDTLVVKQCPVFRINKTKSTQVARNANARFFCFLDMAYERGIKLVLCSNEDDLFPVEEVESVNDDPVSTAAFKRAKSRWMEMSQEEL